MTINLGNLNEDILSIILHFVIESSPRSAASVSFVNHHFYRVSSLLKYRRKSLHLTHGDSSLEKLKILIADPYFLRGLRNLEIDSLVWWKWQSERPCGRPYDTSYEGCPKREDLTEEAVLIIEIVEKAARLETVKITVIPNPRTFNEDGEHQPWQLPHLFVETLQTSHPKAKLLIFGWQRLNSRVHELDLAEETLVRSTSLKTLSISDDYDPLMIAGFNFIVRNAPNLERIEIYSFDRYILYDELRITGSPEVAGRADSHAGPPVTHEGGRKASLKEIYVSNAEAGMNLCDRMASLTNLTQLRSLTIRGEKAIITQHFLQQAASLLPQVVHLNLDAYISKEQSELLTEFLLALPVLESLTLRICPSPVLTRRILSKHGPSLKRLSLGRLLSYESPESNLGSDCLPIVHELCTRLRVLSGVACEENEPVDVPQHKVLNLLSQFAPRISDGVRIIVPFTGFQPRHPPLGKSRYHNAAFHRAYDIHRLVFPPDVQTTGPRILELNCKFRHSSAVWSLRPSERDDEPETLELAMNYATVTAPGRDYTKAQWRKLVKGELRGEQATA
ncbi:MAG: hypothetical protein Q9160_000692 [Pyrenula sp. 1 TL-2023]